MRLLHRFSALAVSLLAAGAMAQSYPARQIHLIVPNAPGGATDVAARLVGPKLSELLGQPIVIENRAGAGAVTGTNYVAKAASDGYTLIMVFDSFTMNPYLFKNVQYDPVRDFAPITLVVRNPQLLVVHPSVGAKNLQEFLRVVRSAGSGFNFATAGAGTSSGLSLELFKSLAKVEPTAIHYKGGAPAVSDLLGGQVSATLITAGVVIQHVRAGKLVPIAITSAKRSPALPEVPTVAEEVPGFEAQSWIGLLAPAGTPRLLVDRLHAAAAKVLAAQDVREKFERQMAEVVAGPPEEFAAWIKSESVRWGKLIRERNIRLD
ncbi:MAG: tripartite tricarboxylate transporter substrate binding protein [Betaproteobacteria bacterium]|nr:tripartite tricarboxylate transporter substrate binding protein [Betaproteobacteria bacterium]